MKEEQNNWLIIFMLLLTIAFTMALWTVNQSQIDLHHKVNQLLNKTIESITYTSDEYKSKNVTGLFIPECAYIVDIRTQRTLQQINTTENHELCHWFVGENYKHFCGNK